MEVRGPTGPDRRKDKEMSGDVKALFGMVTSVDRLVNSKSGNPRWLLGWESGLTARTVTDAQVGYEVSKDLLGKVVQVDLNEAGEIVALEVRS